MRKRRKAWHGDPPESETAARRQLLTVTQQCIERHGLSKVSLSDVASAAGVTRQTVYRYFRNADELFNAAAVLASGGFLQRMRNRVLQHESLAERLVETLVMAIHELPNDVHLSALVRTGDPLAIAPALSAAFVQDEILVLSDAQTELTEHERTELAELLLRLLNSFLEDSGPERSEEALREFFRRWLVPLIEMKLESSRLA